MQLKINFQKGMLIILAALTSAAFVGCGAQEDAADGINESPASTGIIEQSQVTPPKEETSSEITPMVPTAEQVPPTETYSILNPELLPSIPLEEFDRGPISPTRRSPTPVSIVQDPCAPIPQYLFGTYGGSEILDNKAMAICDGKMLRDVDLPVETREIWDYTSRTGRLAYQNYSLMETDSSSLLVFDYWNKTSKKWFEGNVLDAAWAPTFDRNGDQLLAAVVERNPNVGVEREEGVLIIIAGPEKFTPITEADCCLAWSPNGDWIAYLKNNSLFVISLDGGQPRKLAEGVSFQPVWVLEQEAIMYAKENIHIAIADGSENFVPKMPNGKPLFAEEVTSFLWSPVHRRLLVRDALVHNCPCWPDTPNAYWVFELSEDLRRVTHYFYREDSGLPDLLQWRVPGESAYTELGFKIDFLSSSAFPILRGTAASIKANQGTFTLFVGEGFIPDGKKTVTVTSQTQIFNPQGNIIRIATLEDRMRLEVTGQMVLDGYGIVAAVIHVLDG